MQDSLGNKSLIKLGIIKYISYICITNRYNTIMNIEQLVKDNPNDMELGRVIRELCRKEESYFRKHPDVKIYESPDKGNTIYSRPFGGDISERKLETNQLNLFDEIN